MWENVKTNMPNVLEGKVFRHGLKLILQTPTTTGLEQNRQNSNGSGGIRTHASEETGA